MGLKKMLEFVFVFFAVAAFSLTAIAQEKGKAEGAKMEEKKAPAAKEAKAAPKPKETRWSSVTVKSVDATGKMVTLTSKAKKEVMVSVDDKTKIKSGKDDKKLEDLKEGDRVNVTAASMEGKMVAKSINVLPPAKPKPAAKPMDDKAKGEAKEKK